MSYCTGNHTKFYHKYHVVWVTKYRYKVLEGEMRVRIREIIRQTCNELGVQIVKGVLSNDHVHMFLSIPPHVAGLCRKLLLCLRTSIGLDTVIQREPRALTL